VFSDISVFAVLGFSALLLVVSGFTLTAFFQFLAGEVLAVQQSSKWPGFPHNTSLKGTRRPLAVLKVYFLPGCAGFANFRQRRAP